MSRLEALITPSVIRWAREQARLSLEEVAKKVGRPIEEVEGWENGSNILSLAQARRLSEIYRRPLAVFYLPSPPNSFETLRDFRSLPDLGIREFHPDLAFLLRSTKYKQEWIREFLLADGLKPLPFIGSATLASSHREVALEILKILKISPEEQRKCTSRQEALRLWLEKTEKAGVFVLRQGQIPLTEARGFVMVDDIAPFIFVNSGDSKAAQIFTLAHELAHLWINRSGISNLEMMGKPVDPESVQIEVFCNKVAAEAVLEEQIFTKEWQKQLTDRTIEEKIKLVAGTLNVSEEVVARRLLDKRIISQEYYLKLRQFYQERWHEIKSLEREKMKTSKGGPSYYVTMVAKNGYAFTQTVVSAFMAGSLTGRDASSLLNVKVNNFQRLGEAAGIPPQNRGRGS